MARRRVEFGRPSAAQLMPGGVGTTSRADAMLGEYAIGHASRDPHGPPDSPKGAVPDLVGVVKDYMDRIADIARINDEMSITGQIRGQLADGEEVFVDLNDFNVFKGYGSVTVRHSDDVTVSRPPEKTLRVAREDQRFAGVCPANPDEKRTDQFTVRRPDGSTITVRSPTPLHSPVTASPGEGRSREGRDRGTRYDNNDFDRNRSKDLDGDWDGSFDARRVA